MSSPVSIIEHPFAEYVRILGKGKKGSRSLTEQEAYRAMSMVMNDQVEDVQLGAFLMLMRVKEESAEELCGFVQACREAIAAPPIAVDLDWSTYAGKRRHLPWYVLSILTLAQSGMRIFIHGASGHTENRIYTEDVMCALGFKACDTWSDVESELNSRHFAFMPLSKFSAKLSDIVNLKSILGLRSPVNSLSRLLNPLSAPYVIQGIFHPSYKDVHQQAAQMLGYQNVLVLKGEGGEIERNPDGDSQVFYVKEGDLTEEHWPRLFARRHVKPDGLHIEHLKNVWQGQAEDEYGEMAVVSTVALALYLAQKANSQLDAMDQAKHLWRHRDTSYL